MPWETLEMRLSGHMFMGLYVTSYSSLRPLRSERPRVSRELPEEVTDPTGITDPTGCSTFTPLPTPRTAQLHNPATFFFFIWRDQKERNLRTAVAQIQARWGGPAPVLR